MTHCGLIVTEKAGPREGGHAVRSWLVSPSRPWSGPRPFWSSGGPPCAEPFRSPGNGSVHRSGVMHCVENLTAAYLEQLERLPGWSDTSPECSADATMPRRTAR